VLEARKAIDHDPQNSSLRQLLARALWRSGRAEEAIAVIRENIDRNPEAQNNFALLSRWSLQLGDIPMAMRYGVNEWQLEPKNVHKHWNVCLIHIQAWNEVEALRCIDSLLEQNPDYFEARHWKLLIGGDVDADVKLIERQVAANPDVIYHRLQLAEAYLRQGLPNQATVLLSPEFPELQEQPARINAANIWAARMMVDAMTQSGDIENARVLAEAALAFIARSRKLQDGGFSSGVEDVYMLALIGREDEALDILQATVDKGWVFYSYFFFKIPPAALDQVERYLAIKSNLQIRMDSFQKTIAQQIGTNVGY
jgi:predicted Zn-dependent protease